MTEKPINVKLSRLRIAPRKVRLVADLIRGKEVEEARNILKFTVKKASRPLLKLLNSALANAENNFDIDRDEVDLYVDKIVVNEAPTMKRWRAIARGRTQEIKKRSSHIELSLKKVNK